MKAVRLFICVAFLPLVALAAVSCGNGGPAVEEPVPIIGLPELNPLPIAIITKDIVDVTSGQTVTLDGSSSFDPDGGEIVAFAWSQVGGDPVELSNKDQSSTAFVAPDEETILVFELVVTDDENLTSEPSLIEIRVVQSVVVEPPDEIPPDEPELPPAGRRDAVYVAPAPEGSDSEERLGSSADPVASLARALELAREWARPKIHIAPGIYVGSVNVQISNLLIEGEDGVVLIADEDANETISITNSSDVTIKNIEIIGPEKTGSVRSLGIENSENIVIFGATFETPGVDGANSCRDVEILSSENVFVAGNSFTNSGECKNYTAVHVDEGNNVSVAPETETIASVGIPVPNTFTLVPGNEKLLKAIQFSGVANTAIRGNIIRSEEGATLGDGTSITAVSVGDSENASIADNEINIRGGMRSLGLSLRCSQVATNAVITDNMFRLIEISGSQSQAVLVNCFKQGGSFDMSRNRIKIEPKLGVSANLRGIEFRTNMNDVEILLINNLLIMLSVGIDDLATRTGLHFSLMGRGSQAYIYNNTFLVSGIRGEVHALFSDSTLDADGRIFRPTLINNISLADSLNTSNSHFMLRAACETNDCITNTHANLFNTSVSPELDYVRYYDVRPPRTADFSSAPAGNFSQPFNRNNFYSDEWGGEDTSALEGALLENRQPIARDRGWPLNIDTDINGNARDDTPDIGAFEY